MISYLKELIVLTEKEKEFVSEFRMGNYSPELLFDNMSIVKRIKYHPMALWKLMDK